jgi:hypothetical protein
MESVVIKTFPITTDLDKVLLNMGKLIVRRSTGGWLIVAAIGLTIMVSEFIHSNYQINGIVCVGFIFVVSAVVQLLLTGPRVIIDAEGISGMWLGNVKIPWEKIQRAELKYVPCGDPVITLILDDNTRRPMILGGVTVPPEEIYSEITAYIREHQTSTADEVENEDEDDSA